MELIFLPPGQQFSLVFCVVRCVRQDALGLRDNSLQVNPLQWPARSQIRLGFRIRTTALRAPQGSIALGKVSLKPAEIAMLGTIALVVPQRPTLRMALSETSVLLEARAQRDRLITRRAEMVHPLSTRRVSVLLCVIRAL